MQALIWTYLEPNLSILAACLPTYGPLFKDDGPTFITKFRSRIASLMSRGGASSSSKPWGNIASRESSNPSNDRFNGKGRKPGSTVDDDGQELIL